MAFEAALFGRTRYGRYRHCLELIKANAGLAPLWERLCLAAYIGIGPAIAKLFGADTSENWRRADQIIAEVQAVTALRAVEVASLLRRYVSIRMERGDHLPFDEACASIYDQSFYPIVTHFTYAMQPSAAARLGFVREVVRSIGMSHATVADLGCGSGVILSEILRWQPGWTGHGLDISEASVHYARKLAAHKGVGARADFHTGDIARLPYADESLDLVVASEVIEHMPRPDSVLAEVRRVLRPGGKLILTMPLESHTPAHLHTLGSLEDLRSLCERGGLRVRRLEPRWHFGFGDDRRHVFALAEAGAPLCRSDYITPDALRNFPAEYLEPETV